MTTPLFEKRLNRVVTWAALVFVIGFGVTLNRVIQLNEKRFETAYYPVVRDYTFRGWRKEPSGVWSAEVYIYKARPECAFIVDQVLTYVGTTPDGQTVETTHTAVGDFTVGSNRPGGWQRLDQRQEFDSASFVQGTRFQGAILHQCAGDGPTVSLTGLHTVGVDDPWPTYVEAWFRNNQAGLPSDYR